MRTFHSFMASIEAWSAGPSHMPRTGVDVDGFRLETQVDVVPGIEFLAAERDPLLRRLSCKVVLGEVRSVDGRRMVVADHDDAALELLPP